MNQPAVVYGPTEMYPRHPWTIRVGNSGAAQSGWRWLVDNVTHQHWIFLAGQQRFYFTTEEDAVMFHLVCLGDHDAD